MSVHSFFSEVGCALVPTCYCSVDRNAGGFSAAQPDAIDADAVRLLVSARQLTIAGAISTSGTYQLSLVKRRGALCSAASHNICDRGHVLHLGSVAAAVARLST